MSWNGHTHISLESHFWDLGKQCRPISDTRRLIRDYTVCLQEFLLKRKTKKKNKAHTRNPWNWKGPIATSYCDVPTEKVIFKSEWMHVRIWSNGPSTSLICISQLRFFTYMCFQREKCGWIHVLSATFNPESMGKWNIPVHFMIWFDILLHRHQV